MKFQASGFCAVLALGLLAGCNMCQSPFDYCGAVVSPNGCMNCDFGARYGSAYNPPPGVPTPPTTPFVPRPPSPPNELSGEGQLEPPAAETAAIDLDEPADDASVIR